MRPITKRIAGANRHSTAVAISASDSVGSPTKLRGRWTAANGTAVSAAARTGPWRRVRWRCTSPCHAVSSKTLTMSAPKMKVRKRYPPTSSSQLSGVATVPVARATATVASGTAPAATSQFLQPILQCTTPRNRRRTPSGPERRAVAIAPPSRTT
jgi:hypothetical protein